MEILAVSLATVALLLTLGIEWLKRPRLEIVPSPFSPSGPISFTFAAVQVKNKPLQPPGRWILSRSSADGCRVTLDFLRWGSGDRAIPAVPGRWSSHPEPVRSIPIAHPPQPPQAGKWTVVATFEAQYDPSLDPRENDVRAADAGEEVAVAILTDEGAFAWGTESYNYDGWAKPEWELKHGTYKVVVAVEGSSVSKRAEFKLEYLDEDFGKFRLQTE